MMSTSTGSLDQATSALVGLASAIAAGGDERLSTAVDRAVSSGVGPIWGDELLLQSILMVGWPKALVAASVWRASVPLVEAIRTDGDPDTDYRRHREWVVRGEVTCRQVYGENYTKLRANQRALHPAFEAWMLTEGYGRTISRPGLDLMRRELCIVAQTAVLDTPRQFHSHLRGSLAAGATVQMADAILVEVLDLVDGPQMEHLKDLVAVVFSTGSDVR